MQIRTAQMVKKEIQIFSKFKCKRFFKTLHKMWEKADLGSNYR